MGRLEISQWGHNINNELKYTYEKEYEEKPDQLIRNGSSSKKALFLLRMRE